MKLQDNMIVKGSLYIKLWDGRTGQIKQEKAVDNLVVTAGLKWMAKRWTNILPEALTSMAVGSGATVPAMTDEALEAELGRAPLLFQGATGNEVTYTAIFGAGVGTGPLSEAGIFNNTDPQVPYDPDTLANTMLNRATFGVVTKSENDVMQIVWKITQAVAA